MNNMQHLRMQIASFCVSLALASFNVTADEAPELSGAELYQTFCATCHGKNARGDGPMADMLKPQVPDLTQIAARNGGTFPKNEVRRRVDGQSGLTAHGTSDMPIWGWELYAIKGEDAPRRKRVAELIGRVVDYLESIQRR